jgi:hypothetical protein
MARTVTFTLAALVAAISASRVTRAFAFDVEGLRTGMTVDQVAAEVQRRGLTLRLLLKGEEMNVYSALRIERSGQLDPNAPIITISFCGGRLVGFIHNIDFDTEYLPTLKGILEQHGNPARVSVDSSPWSGSGDGYVTQAAMVWYFGDDRITLNFNPESRNARGTLRYSHSSSVGYQSKSQQCVFPAGDEDRLDQPAAALREQSCPDHSLSIFPIDRVHSPWGGGDPGRRDLRHNRR